MDNVHFVWSLRSCVAVGIAQAGHQAVTFGATYDAWWRHSRPAYVAVGSIVPAAHCRTVGCRSARMSRHLRSVDFWCLLMQHISTGIACAWLKAGSKWTLDDTLLQVFRAPMKINSVSSGAEYIEHGGHVSPPTLQMAGHGDTMSRTANNKLTKLYWPKRLLVFLEPKKWRGKTNFFLSLHLTPRWQQCDL